MDTEEKTEGRVGCLYWIIPLLLMVLFWVPVYYTSEIQDVFYKVNTLVTKIIIKPDTTGNETLIPIMSSRDKLHSLEEKFQQLRPSKPYIVINTTDNRFSLRNAGGDTIRTGLCSTGKDNILIKGDKRWVFKTPRGMFTIINKRRSPVWTKPDWAFIEEGLPVPSTRSSKRIDPYTLGDYALGLGDGYYIHGTLYQRRIGVPETHGCVRIGDADLEVIYKTLSVGSKVYIY
jgi:L,D-transpeptidase ErfK/SrfK